MLENTLYWFQAQDLGGLHPTGSVRTSEGAWVFWGTCGYLDALWERSVRFVVTVRDQRRGPVKPVYRPEIRGGGMGILGDLRVP